MNLPFYSVPRSRQATASEIHAFFKHRFHHRRRTPPFRTITGSRHCCRLPADRFSRQMVCTDGHSFFKPSLTTFAGLDRSRMFDG